MMCYPVHHIGMGINKGIKFFVKSTHVLVEAYEENKILLKKESDCKSNNYNSQTVPFQPEFQQKALSFQSLQAQNKDLLTNCSELHERMALNRKNRLHAQQQLSKAYRELSQNSADYKLPGTDKKVLQSIRQRISDLEEEHVSLHKRYIAQQTLFRETVRDQRRMLVNSVNRTRALSSNTGIGLSLVTGIPAEKAYIGDAQNDSGLTYLDRRKSA